jgi:hypothetical protein
MSNQRRTTDHRLDEKYSADAWRKATPAPEQSDVLDLTLPSGFTVQVTRPPLEMWIMAGAIPLELMDQAMSVLSANTEEEKLQRQQGVEEALQSDPEKLRKALIFMRDAVTRALVRPRIVVGADPNNPDEIDPKDVPVSDFSFIFQWVMRGSSGIVIPTTNGKGTTLENVETFPKKSGVRGSRSHVRSTKRANKRKARHKG